MVVSAMTPKWSIRIRHNTPSQWEVQSNVLPFLNVWWYTVQYCYSREDAENALLAARERLCHERRTIKQTGACEQ